MACTCSGQWTALALLGTYSFFLYSPVKRHLWMRFYLCELYAFAECVCISKRVCVCDVDMVWLRGIGYAECRQILGEALMRWAIHVSGLSVFMFGVCLVMGMFPTASTWPPIQCTCDCVGQTVAHKTALSLVVLTIFVCSKTCTYWSAP